MEFLMYPGTKRPCRCGCGHGLSIKEYYGFCENCWMKLTPQQRAALEKREQVIVVEEVRPSKASSYVDRIWRFIISGVVLYLVWKGAT